ncbi:MAG: DinB family protein [Pseudomonadales bacterium]
MPSLPVNLSTLVEDNVKLLDQLDGVLLALDDVLYTNNESALFDSPVGLHVRHALDHYACFLHGLTTGLIDYDARARDAQVEASSESAQQRLHNLRNAIQELDLADRDLLVRQASGTSGQIPLRSSVARELVFLHSHTVHHQASIAALLRLLGVSELAPDDFGFAPATLQYKGAERCAR